MAKGGKKGGNKKGSSAIPKPGTIPAAEGAPRAAAPPYQQGDIIMHSLEVIESYFRAVGSPIFASPVDVASAARALWEADFAVLSHGTEEDPVFNYGNAKALELFESTWEEFTVMPSRYSCPDPAGTERQELLEAAQAGPRDLQGLVRVSTKGRRLRVDQGVLWTLIGGDGENIGQAAVLRQWHFVDEEGKRLGEAGADSAAQGHEGAAAAVVAAAEGVEQPAQ